MDAGWVFTGSSKELLACVNMLAFVNSLGTNPYPKKNIIMLLFLEIEIRSWDNYNNEKQNS